jgi:hypothetical protein
MRCRGALEGLADEFGATKTVDACFDILAIPPEMVTTVAEAIRVRKFLIEKSEKGENENG